MQRTKAHPLLHQLVKGFPAAIVVEHVLMIAITVDDDRICLLEDVIRARPIRFIDNSACCQLGLTELRRQQIAAGSEFVRAGSMAVLARNENHIGYCN